MKMVDLQENPKSFLLWHKGRHLLNLLVHNSFINTSNYYLSKNTLLVESVDCARD